MAMGKTAEVVIIGAGVIGTSIAYHLAKAGCHDVIVLEKDAIGMGATAKSEGGIRQQFSGEVNIRLSMESVNFFQDFEEETEQVPDFRQCGYMLLAVTESEMQAFRKDVTLQQELGVEVHLLPPNEAKKIIPPLNIEDVIGVAYCPTDGVADPYSIVQGFASAAKRLGVKIYEDAEVTGIIIARNQVQGVLTRDARFEAPVVVNAAGPYAGQVGKMAAIDIPVRPSKQHIFFTGPTAEFPKDGPLIIDVHNSFAIRKDGHGLTFSRREPNAPEGFDIAVDWSCLADIAETAIHRFPFLENVGIKRAQAGLKDNTPDYSAILGGVPNIDGIYLACGFSGHGVMHAPAVGRLMAAYILDGEPDSAISTLSLDRFQVGGLECEDAWIMK